MAQPPLPDNDAEVDAMLKAADAAQQPADPAQQKSNSDEAANMLGLDPEMVAASAAGVMPPSMTPVAAADTPYQAEFRKEYQSWPWLKQKFHALMTGPQNLLYGAMQRMPAPAEGADMGGQMPAMYGLDAPLGATPTKEQEEASKQRAEDLQQRIERNRVIANEAPFTSFASNLATTAPMFMVPGAGTVLGSTVLGTGLGALEPTMPGENPGINAIMGGVFGAAVPTALSQFGRSFLPSVKADKAAAKVGEDLLKIGLTPENVNARPPQTPGYRPTLAEAAQSPEVAIFQRQAARADQAAGGNLQAAIAKRGENNNQAWVSALDSLIGDKEGLEAGRKELSSQMYAATDRANVPVDSALAELRSRPAIQAAEAHANTVARNRGLPAIVQGKDIPPTITPIQSLLLDEHGNPMPPTGFHFDPGQSQTFSGRGLHWMKEALDDMIDNPNAIPEGFKTTSADAMIEAKRDLLGWMDQNLPGYGFARNLHREMSRPINVSNTASKMKSILRGPLFENEDFTPEVHGQAFSKATEDLASRIPKMTGFRGATPENALTPEALQTMRGIQRDLGSRWVMNKSGAGWGSPTQESISNPLLKGAAVMVGAHLPVLGKVGLKAMTRLSAPAKVSAQYSDQLGSAILDPAHAAQLMERARYYGSPEMGAGFRLPAAAGVSALETLSPQQKVGDLRRYTGFGQ